MNLEKYIKDLVETEIIKRGYDFYNLLTVGKAFYEDVFTDFELSIKLDDVSKEKFIQFQNPKSVTMTDASIG